MAMSGRFKRCGAQTMGAEKSVIPNCAGMTKNDQA